LNTLAHFTDPNLIVSELQSSSAADVVGELCLLLCRLGRISDSAAFLDAVINRERLCSTAMAPDWALPHARLCNIGQLSFALARISQPLVWFAETGIRVQMVFLFAVPEEEARTYLSVVAALAKLSKKTSILEQLRAAPDGNAIFRILKQIPLSRPAAPVGSTPG